MSTTINLGTPTAFSGGIETSQRFVGVNSGANLVLRYTFKAPDSGIVTKVKFLSSFAWLSSVGITGTTSYPMRLKLSKSATSHINAGASTSDYDATITLTANLAEGSNVFHEVSAEIGDLSLAPGETCYLYLFPGVTTAHIFYCYDTSGNDQSQLVTVDVLSGLMYVGDGEDWAAYEPYVGNGESWDLCTPYVGDGTTWGQCG